MIRCQYPLVIRWKLSRYSILNLQRTEYSSVSAYFRYKMILSTSLLPSTKITKKWLWSAQSASFFVIVTIRKFWRSHPALLQKAMLYFSFLKAVQIFFAFLRNVEEIQRDFSHFLLLVKVLTVQSNNISRLNPNWRQYTQLVEGWM